MKYAILSDIHSNLEALESVMADARAQGVKHFICLGDIVGYNANPSECIDIIRSLGCTTVMGNHDAYTVADEIPDVVNGRARRSLEWTRENITPEQYDWLHALPMQRRVGNFQIVHASLHEPDQWNYVVNAMEASLHFHFQHTPLCFFGHTHQPSFFSTKKQKTYRDYTRIDLKPEYKYLINVGSVGQPRQEDKRAQYAIYDTREHTVIMRKVLYNISLACKKIRAAGLPEHNALRLEKSELEAAALFLRDTSATATS